jgi:hypothetical protein
MNVRILISRDQYSVVGRSAVAKIVCWLVPSITVKHGRILAPKVRPHNASSSGGALARPAAKLRGVALTVGTGFGVVALKMGSADMEKAEREPYMLRGFVMTNVGAIGIVFVLVTGLVMFFQDSTALLEKGGPFLWVKAVAFGPYLTVFVTLRWRVSKARLTNGGPLMTHMSKFVMVMNFLGIVLIVSSVLAFH